MRYIRSTMCRRLARFGDKEYQNDISIRTSGIIPHHDQFVCCPCASMSKMRTKPPSRFTTVLRIQIEYADQKLNDKMTR